MPCRAIARDVRKARATSPARLNLLANRVLRLPTTPPRLTIERMSGVQSSFSQVTFVQRRTLLAAALGWMLDAFDAMLYALVLAYVMRELGMSKSTAGFLQMLTLLASGVGGVLFGFIADRIGRKQALMLSI